MKTLKINKKYDYKVVDISIDGARSTDLPELVGTTIVCSAGLMGILHSDELYNC